MAAHPAAAAAATLPSAAWRTEHLLLGLASEGEGVAARVLQELGAGLLELREAVAAQYAAGVEPEPFPPDRGPPPWEPSAGARLRRVIPLAQEFPLPSGDLLVLLSLEVWSDWFDPRYAVVYATPEPEGELPRPAVLGGCEVSDRAGAAAWRELRRLAGGRLRPRPARQALPVGGDRPEQLRLPGTHPGLLPPGGPGHPESRLGPVVDGPPCGPGRAACGDLMFFAYNADDPSTIHHVGMCIGGGPMVEMPFTGAKVRVSSIGGSDHLGATRLTS